MRLQQMLCIVYVLVFAHQDTKTTLKSLAAGSAEYSICCHASINGVKLQV